MCNDLKVNTSTLALHLRAAACRYQIDVEALSEHPPIANQFALKRDECNKLANAFEALDHASVDGDLLALTFARIYQQGEQK